MPEIKPTVVPIKRIPVTDDPPTPVVYKSLGIEDGLTHTKLHLETIRLKKLASKSQNPPHIRED